MNPYLIAYNLYYNFFFKSKTDSKLNDIKRNIYLFNKVIPENSLINLKNFYRCAFILQNNTIRLKKFRLKD